MLTDDQRKLAFEAIDKARTLREHLRRKTSKGDRTRNAAIQDALKVLNRAMKPIRSEIHRTQFWPSENGYRQSLMWLSADCQKERRKLWKLKQAAKRSDRAAVDILRDRIK